MNYLCIECIKSLRALSEQFWSIYGKSHNSARVSIPAKFNLISTKHDDIQDDIHKGIIGKDLVYVDPIGARSGMIFLYTYKYSKTTYLAQISAI